MKAAYPARPGPSHVAGPTSVISMMNLALQERQSFMDVIEDIEEKTEMIVELTTMKNSFRVAQKGFIRKKTVAAETDVSSVADMNRAICMAAENLQMGQTLDHVFSRNCRLQRPRQQPNRCGLERFCVSARTLLLATASLYCSFIARLLATAALCCYFYCSPVARNLSANMFSSGMPSPLELYFSSTTA